MRQRSRFLVKPIGLITPGHRISKLPGRTYRIALNHLSEERTFVRITLRRHPLRRYYVRKIRSHFQLSLDDMVEAMKYPGIGNARGEEVIRT
jgi:hypothetical protein